MSEVKRFKPVINSKPYKPYAFCEENEEGIYVRIHDYAALKAERDALAAAHSELRESMAAIHNTIRLDGVNTSLSSLLSASKRAHEASLPTDAYANQLRAEGVEMFAKHFNCADISDDILEFAANLRKENGNG